MKAAARARLEMAADRMAKKLLKIAVDDEAPASVKLAAIKDALDRAGVSAKTAVEVSVGPMEPWQELLSGFTGLSGGSRAEARAARGEGSAAHGLAVLDAEVVADLHYCDGCERPFPAELPDWLDDWPDYCSACRSQRGLPDPPRQAVLRPSAPTTPTCGVARRRPHPGRLAARTRQLGGRARSVRGRGGTACRAHPQHPAWTVNQDSPKWTIGLA